MAPSTTRYTTCSRKQYNVLLTASVDPSMQITARGEGAPVMPSAAVSWSCGNEGNRRG